LIPHQPDAPGQIEGRQVSQQNQTSAGVSSEEKIDSRLTAGVPLNSQEHIDLIAQFERDRAVKGFRLDKEAKAEWARGHIYQHGELNELFLMYRRGYVLGKAVALGAAAQVAA
jgi:hypothetical protein